MTRYKKKVSLYRYFCDTFYYVYKKTRGTLLDAQHEKQNLKKEFLIAMDEIFIMIIICLII